MVHAASLAVVLPFRAGGGHLRSLSSRVGTWGCTLGSCSFFKLPWPVHNRQPRSPELVSVWTTSTIMRSAAIDLIQSFPTKYVFYPNPADHCRLTVRISSPQHDGVLLSLHFRGERYSIIQPDYFTLFRTWQYVSELTNPSHFAQMFVMSLPHLRVFVPSSRSRLTSALLQ
jgi:hypothetical protein